MKCPNCGKEIPDNSKFCTYCGFQIPQVAATGAQPQNTQPQFGPTNQTQPNQFNNGQANYNQNMNQQPNFSQPNQGGMNTNATMDQTSAYAKNYWSYLMHGVRRPTDYLHSFNKYFGLISLLLGSLLIALTMTMMESHSVGGLLGSLDSYANTNTQSSVGFGTFFGALVLTLIGEFILYSMAHWVTRGFLGDKSAGYMENMTRYAHISSIGLLVAGVGFVLSIFGAFAIPIAMLCMMFYNIMLSCSFVALIFMAKPTNHFDRVYAYLVSVIVMFLIFVVIITIVGVSVGASVIGNLGSLFQ